MKRIFSVIISVFALSLSLMPSAIAADTTPPQLVEWILVGPDVVNLYTNDQNVVTRFILSDESDIALPKLLLKSLSTMQMTPFATVKELSRSGKFISYEAQAIIKFGQSPRNWEWVLYPLKDVLGNTSTSFGPGGSWPKQVTVVDNSYTVDIFTCENALEPWNKEVSRFQLLETKYNGFQEIASLRLRIPVPIIKIGIDTCTTDIRMANQTTQSWRSLSAGIEGAESDINSRLREEKALAEIAAATEAEAKAVADKAAADLKSKQEADAKAVAAKAAATKKTTITCVKGKLIKKVTAVKPKCPTGYKKK